MGLPDTSPAPKKDSMGMDYIPVYEGEDSDDGSVKLSPGKIQRTGVKSEPAAKRVIRTAIRAPGHDPARRAAHLGDRDAVRKLGSEGRRRHHRVRTVVKGQPLMEIYSPAVSSAAAEYIATISSKTTGGDAAYGRGSRQRLMNLDVPDAAIAAMEKQPAPFRSRSIGWRRATASCWSATRSRACARSPATCCSGSPTFAWCGR